MKRTADRSPGLWAALLVAPVAIAAALASTAAPAAANDGDRVVFGSDVTIKQGEEISGDLVVFGGDAKVYGKVDGDAVVMGGDLYIASTGEVDGSTVAFGGEVDNESSSAGGGTPHHHGTITPPIVTIPPVPVTPIEPVVPSVPEEEHHGPPSGWIGVLVVSGILSLLVFALAPGAVRSVRDHFIQRPAIGALIGFTWPFWLSAVMIALAITVIGIVLMPVAVLAIFVAYLVGRAAIAQLLGRRIFEVANVMEPAPLATAALGIVIFTVLEAIVPMWMGIVFEACISCLAIGAALLPFAQRRQHVFVAPAGSYIPPPAPVFTPPSPPPPPGPPAVPQ